MNDRFEARHLSDEDIAKAVAERDSLPEAITVHLAGCPTCARKLARFEGRLAGMARMARQTAPSPARPFRLAQTHRSEPFWQRKSILAMGISALVLLAVVVWRPLQFSGPQSPPTIAFDAAADRRLMEEIDALVDNALPEAYQQLAFFDSPDLLGGSDAGGELFDWIVPALDEDEEDDFLS